MKLKMKYMKLKNRKRKLNEKILNINQKNYTYDFQQYERIRSFGESIYNLKASIVETEEDQSNLLENIVKLINKSRPRTTCESV